MGVLCNQRKKLNKCVQPHKSGIGAETNNEKREGKKCRVMKNKQEIIATFLPIP